MYTLGMPDSTATARSLPHEPAALGGLVRLHPARTHLVPDGDANAVQGTASGLGDIMAAIRRLGSHAEECPACRRFLGAPHVVFGLTAPHLLAQVAPEHPESLAVWLPADVRRRVLEDSQRHPAPPSP
jgi:hypothetical protein